MKKTNIQNRPHLTKFERRNRRRKQKRFIIMLTCALVACVILGTVLTVKSQSVENVRISDEAYREFEKEYIKDVRMLLEEEGFANSGVTLTKEYRDDGTRNYEVLIHHKWINELSDKEQEELKAALLQIPFPMQGCNFDHEFLVRA